MEVQFILTTIVVNFVLASAQSRDQPGDQFQNLFDSIARNDERRNEAYRDIVKDNVRKDRYDFDAIKDELIGNIHRRRNFYEKSNADKEIALTKRETKKGGRNDGVAVATKVAKGPGNKTLYMAVLPMEGFEKFYHNVGLLNLAQSLFVKNEKVDEKKNQCETIFRKSVMIDLEAADVVDPSDKEIQDELQAKRPDLYERYYKTEEFKDPIFVYDYRRYNFSIANVVTTETVFPCLARKRSSGNIEEYLISQAYNLPRLDAPTGNERKVASRYVFLRDETNETKLLAMVDKVTEDVYPINAKYCERSELTDLTRSKDLCELPDIQRIRLCAMLFNSKQYSQLVEYPASSTPECREWKLSLHCAEGEGDLEFTDAAVECTAIKNGAELNSLVTYYVSRGLKQYQFFVATPEEGIEGPVVKEVFSSYTSKLKPTVLSDQPLA